MKTTKLPQEQLDYTAPTIEVITVGVESGFAQSSYPGGDVEPMDLF